MFTLTIFIILTMFAIDLSLSILNYRHRHSPIPDNVADVYDKKDYARWLDYTMEVFRLSIIVKVTDTILLLVFLFAGLFPKIASITEQWTRNPIISTMLFLALYGVISYVLGVGFKLYRTFNIEERYGFNTTTTRTFVTDQIKSIGLTIVLGGLLLYPLLYLYMKMGNRALGYAWLLIVSVSLAINLLYTKVFIRLFNKLTPLEEGELYDSVQALAKTTGYTVKEISIMDASKRSARLNAFFSGFGKFKHIILFDTLIEKCSTDEIVSVLAHEIGHAKHKDVLQNFFISTIQMGFYLSILTFFLSSTSFAKAFGFVGPHMGFAMILFGILMEPLGLMLSIPLSAHSRKAEYKADAFAAESGYKEAMICALKILSRENFSNLTPHPLLVKLTYSHPPVTDRIRALEQD